MPNRFKSLLEVLAQADVQFILIGGVAANLHGSACATFDIDIVYACSRENFAAIALALAPIAPYLRGAPPGRPKDCESVAERRAIKEEREKQ